MRRSPGNSLLTCALLVSAVLTAFAAPADEPPRSGATVLPRTFLRGFDPITVWVESDRGPKAGGPEDHPEATVRIDPAPPGEYRWLDARTLIFKPAVAWPPLARYAITASGQTRTLTTMMVKPEAVLPADGAQDLDPVEEITLTFAEPIEPAILAKMVSFEVRRLPGVDRSDPRRLGPEDFTIKALERSTRKDPARYVFQLKKPIDNGLTVLTRVRLALDDTTPDAMASYSFSTKEPFRVTAAGCSSGELPGEEPEPEARASDEEQASGDEEGDAGSSEESPEDEAPAPKRNRRRRSAVAAPDEVPGMLPLTVAGTRYTREQAVNGGAGVPRIAVQFSAELARLSLSEVKTLIRFTPSIPDMSYSQTGRNLWITGQIERDTVYQAALSPVAIKDRAGRPLRMEGPSEFYFYYSAQASYLRWGQSQGTLERFGPQVFPMSARRDARVDLRIHKIDPLDRNFWPFPSHPVVVDESTRPPGPGEEPPSANTLDHALNATDLKLRLMMLGSPPVSTLTALPVRREGGATEFGLPLKEHLAALSGVDEPGTYLLGIRRLNGETSRAYVRIQVTDLCLTTIEEERAVQFLVTSLKSGRPVPGATVTLEGQSNDVQKPGYRTLLSGSTDPRGLFRHRHDGRLPGEPKRLVVKKDGDTLVLLASEPPHTFSNNHWHRSRSNWLGWLAKDPPDAPLLESLLMAHLLTERPVYRPEEEVHVKGLLRVRDGGRLRLAPTDAYELAIVGPGEKRWTFPVQMTPEGSFHHKFQDENLPTGDYSATLKNVKTGKAYGEVEWKAEAYTIPKFEVELHGPDRVPLDQPFTLTATAKYYAGGRVVGQPTRWRVTQMPYVYTPPEAKGFAFSSDERFSKSGRFTAPAALVKTGSTDDSGASAMTVNPAIELDARPRRYAFEATVTGADEQTVTNTRQIIALPPFVLGVKVDRFQKAGQTITPEILAVGVDGKPVVDQEVTVRLLQRQWHSTLTESDFATRKPKYVTDVVEQEVFTTRLRTKAGPVPLPIPAPGAGIFVVEVSARDKVGRLQLVSVDLYKGGSEALAWKKPEANVFDTAPDKTLYAPGDTARVLLKSPYQSAHVLAIVEGPDGNTYQELAVEGGKALFELPIKNEYHPRVPVHFVLMRGRVSAGLVGGADLGKPGTMAATTWLKVDPVDNRVNVTLTHPEKALPGQEISIDVRLTTPAGKPAAGEVTLWLVDQAVLSLGNERELDPLPSFIREVRSRLAIRDTRNKIVGEVVTEESPGGGGAEEPGLLGRTTPRKKFKTVPFYDPRIMVDATGVKKVTFKLSDDLTNFKVRAVVASGPDRFGSAKSTIAVRLPVIVQPALPRFVRISDTFTAGGIGRIVEGAPGAGRYEVKAHGARITGAAAGAMEWKKDRPEKLFFPMQVEVPAIGDGRSAPELTLSLAVQRDADGARDAFEVKLPVRPDRDPVRVEAYRKLIAGQSISFPEFDRDVRDGSVKQEALITDSEAVLKMLAALDYLYAYRHECTEQRVSQCFPALALSSLLSTFKLEQAGERDAGMFAATIDYLGKTLQPGGLYAFWPGSEGHVSLTAYVVEFLTTAKKHNREFPARLLEKPIAALKEALRSDYAHFVSGAAATERADALRALSLAGAFDEAYGAELASKAGYLDADGQSAVLLAYAAGRKGGDEVTRKLRRELWANAVFKLQGGQEVYGGLQTRVPEDGGLVLASETRTLANMIRALYPEEKTNPRMRMMVAELVRTADKDGWGTTRTNAAALLALEDVVEAPRTWTSPPHFEVSAGDEKRALVLDSAHPTAHFTTGRAAPAQVTWTGGADGETFFARLAVTSVPKATGDTVPARSAGFVVRHEVVRVPDDASAPVRTWIDSPGQTLTFRAGDVVEEHVQVVNPTERHFVSVVAPLAAGMEPLNPNLKTAPPEARASERLTLEPSYSAYLDDEARFYYETLPAGTYDFYFRTRATVEGSFVHPGAHAEMMYRPTVSGSSAGVRYAIEKREGN